jgi:4-hydroxyphenylalkanoate synthase
MTTAPEIERSILGWLSEIVGPSVAQTVDPEASFFDYGVDSLAVVKLCAYLSERLGKTVSDDMILDHPTPRALAEFLADSPL